jgi:hypothetical protein
MGIGLDGSQRKPLNWDEKQYFNFQNNEVLTVFSYSVSPQNSGLPED